MGIVCTIMANHGRSTPRRAGRPNVEGERRTYSLRVPITPADRERFEKLAQKEQRALADWVRVQLKQAADRSERAA